MRSTSILLLLALALVVTSGCVERRLVITSEPEGADVIINNSVKGKTPYVHKFKHYGVYSVRVMQEGYYPVNAKEPVDASFANRTGPDFISNVMVPRRMVDEHRLHYTLVPIGEPDSLESVMARGEEFAAASRKLIEERQSREQTRKPFKAPLPVSKRFQDDVDEAEKKEVSDDDAQERPSEIGGIELPADEDTTP